MDEELKEAWRARARLLDAQARALEGCADPLDLKGPERAQAFKVELEAFQTEF